MSYDIFSKDISTLRNELNELKKCQMDSIGSATKFSFSLLAAGLLVFRLTEKSVIDETNSIMVISVLIILTGYMAVFYAGIFFDKGKSVTRISSLVRILEGLRSGNYIIADYPGIERLHNYYRLYKNSAACNKFFLDFQDFIHTDICKANNPVTADKLQHDGIINYFDPKLLDEEWCQYVKDGRPKFWQILLLRSAHSFWNLGIYIFATLYFIASVSSIFLFKKLVMLHPDWMYFVLFGSATAGFIWSGIVVYLNGYRSILYNKDTYIFNEAIWFRILNIIHDRRDPKNISDMITGKRRKTDPEDERVAPIR